MTETEYFTSIVSPLLSFPDKLRIEKSTDERGVFLRIFVAQTDMGRIIGREGKTIEAIRILVRMFGTMTQQSISLKVEEPHENAGEFRNKPVWGAQGSNGSKIVI